MRRDINQADIVREANECFETVSKEGEMRRNAQDADDVWTMGYPRPPKPTSTRGLTYFWCCVFMSVVVGFVVYLKLEKR